MLNRYSVSGKTGTKGELMLYASDDMKEFLRKFPNSRLTMEIKIHEPQASHAIRGYYMNKVVPDFQKAFREVMGERMTLKATEEHLRKMYPFSFEEYADQELAVFENERLKDLSEFSNRDMVDFIEHLKMIASVEFDLFIEDPSNFNQE